MAGTVTPELFVHNQLLDLIEPVFRDVDSKPQQAIGWQSHPDWEPQLIVANVDIATANPYDKVVTRAAFVMDDAEVLADRNIAEDYMNNPFDLDYLEMFSRYFSDPKFLCLGGLVVITRPSLELPRDDVSESTDIDFVAMDFVT